MTVFVSDERVHQQSPSSRYVVPFAAFLLFLAVSPRLPISPYLEPPARVLILALICIACWPREIQLRPVQPLLSIGLGIGVFALWIGPDLLFPGYRNSLLFSNSLVGHLQSSIQPEVLHSRWVLGWRTARAVLIVPVVEELFWRAWLMRWLINTDFQRVELGAYSAIAFWVTAALFASEHGPYWDVGLLTGLIYNWWMVRTKSVGNCILMHAVTNAALSAYVIATSQWQYWQ